MLLRTTSFSKSSRDHLHQQEQQQIALEQQQLFELHQLAAKQPSAKAFHKHVEEAAVEICSVVEVDRRLEWPSPNVLLPVRCPHVPYRFHPAGLVGAKTVELLVGRAGLAFLFSVCC